MNNWMRFGVVGVLLITFFVLSRKRGWLSRLTEYGLISDLDEFFKGRESLDDDEFYIKYFQDQGIQKEIPIKVRKIFEEQFEADFSRISDKDDFSEDMKFIWGYDSMVDVEIVMALEDEFGIKISDNEAENLKSIHDIVMCICSKQPKPNNPLDRTASTRSDQG